MDAERFDRIAMLVGRAAGRRGVVRLLVGGVAAALAPRHGQIAFSRQACAAPCAADEDCCNGNCQYLGADDRCGACTTVCARGETCQACVSYAPDDPNPYPSCPAGPANKRHHCCPPGTYNSNGACCASSDPPQVNCCSVADADAKRCVPACLPLTEIPGQDPVLVDDAHCGRCGHRCGDGQRCVAGACVCQEGTRDCGEGICRRCCADAECASGQRCCAGVCQACCTDADCANLDHTCQGGVCACRDGTQACDDGICAAAGRCCDNTDCPSGSGTICPSSGGTCQCPSGLKDCAGVCHECCNASDCDFGRTCQQNVCRCPSGQHDCEGTCRQCCDDDHCVGDQRCQDGVCACPTATTNCGSGVCAVAGHCCTDADCPSDSGKICPASGGVCGCSDDKKECDGRCIASNACCTNADCPRDSGQICPLAGATCRCPDDQRDCNGVCRTCCTDADCGGGQTCQSGICACPPGTLVCGGGVCAPPGHCCSNAECTNGEVCRRPGEICRCRDGWAVCGGVCINLRSDRRNCGACGNSCGPQQHCALGRCLFSHVLDPCTVVICPSPSICLNGRCINLRPPIPFIPERPFE